MSSPPTITVTNTTAIDNSQDIEQQYSSPHHQYDQQQQVQQQRRHTSAIPFIVGNEFCERFSFYGLKTILYVYLTTYLQFNDSRATGLLHIFVMLAYLFPLFGGALSDSVLGKYRTILYLSIVYCLGNLVISVTSIPGIMPGQPPSPVGLIVGLILLAMGTGGIKPCVSAFGGDQFSEGQTVERQQFFSLFYFAINSGSLLSTYLTPELRAVHCWGQQSCFPLAFGVPAVLMVVAVVVFVAGRKRYRIVEPVPGSRNVLLTTIGIIWGALTVKSRPMRLRLREGCFRWVKRLKLDRLFSSAAASASSSSTNNNDYRPLTPVILTSTRRRGSGGNNNNNANNNDNNNNNNANNSDNNDDDNNSDNNDDDNNHIDDYDSKNEDQHWLDCVQDKYGEQEIEDLKKLLAVLKLFLPLPVFWALFDQQASRWVAQAQQMQTQISLGATTTIDIKPEQMQLCNALLILLMIPLFERLIYPALRRFHFHWGSLGRMATGMILTGLSFVLAAFLQINIDSQPPLSVPILAQLPQYIVITAGEILFSITGLEFAYSQAPQSMKSVCQAMWLLTVSAGNLLVVVVAESNWFGSASAEFFFFSVFVFLAALIFVWISRPFSRSADYLRLSYGGGSAQEDHVQVGQGNNDQ